MNDCIEKYKKEKYETLDITNIRSEYINILFNTHIFNPSSLQHLFVSRCDLINVPDLSLFVNLITLDLSHNLIQDLNKLPDTLQELNVSENKLQIIDCKLPNLLRLVATNNYIETFSFNHKLESIYLTNNPIQIIPGLNFLHTLEISHTNVCELNIFPELKYLDCSYTDVQKIINYPKLQTLICNHSKVSDIRNIAKIETIEMIGTTVQCIEYLKELKTIQYSNCFNLSKQYNILCIKKNKNNVFELMLKL